MKKLFLSFLILFTAINVYGSSEFTLERSVLTESVEDREPGIAKEVFSLYSKAYFYTEFKNIGEEKTISHNWYYLDEEGERNLVMSVPLKISGPRWRTWSNKNLYFPGKWSVEVVDEKGNLITKNNFTIE